MGYKFFPSSQTAHVHYSFVHCFPGGKKKKSNSPNGCLRPSFFKLSKNNRAKRIPMVHKVSSLIVICFHFGNVPTLPLDALCCVSNYFKVPGLS